MSTIPAALGLDSDQVASLLRAAGRAPSVHNTQPWRFRVTPHAIELHTDPARRLPVSDPDDRELRLACGAALFNLRTALLGLGIRPIVTLYPVRGQPELLAVVRHGGRKTPTPQLTRLLRALPLRRTNRRPFSDTAVAAPEQHALRRAALDENGWLHIVAGPAERAEVGRLAAQAHEIQMADPGFRAELAAWTGAEDGRCDGVPASAGGPLPEEQDTWVLRDFTAGRGRTRVDGKDFENEPLIAVLSAHLAGPDAELQAGLALEHVLLTATVHGLAVSFLSQLTEVPEIREKLRRLISGAHPPQAVLRIGYGWPVAATPRRPVENLLMPEPSTAR
ncbi:Acg family FMN-binding oxidoreductase [Pseudonocardia acidicola]|uniref:Nitroreductase n=1 Tax=Pseudonocardia acidicola TaxID=2724939 RepID=A0ABX1S9R9_9PSEU|nr:nitroreductase family protein [Pseudonocardia acidicola]NMH97622.1 nitroreductase [Pseudonocardia acidicola]